MNVEYLLDTLDRAYNHAVMGDNVEVCQELLLLRSMILELLRECGYRG